MVCLQRPSLTPADRWCALNLILCLIVFRVVFLRELFNGLIEAVINEVEPRGVFGLDPLDAEAKITGAVEVVGLVCDRFGASAQPTGVCMECRIKQTTLHT